MALPTGTVTFLFTDIEGSTRLLEGQPDVYRASLARHDAMLERAISTHDGVVFQRAGDALCAAFVSPIAAVRAALDAQRALHREASGRDGSIAVRMGLHTGQVEVRNDEYFGIALNRCARLMGSAHGGQTVLSTATASLVRETLPADAWLKDLGEHRLRDLTQPERIYELVAPDLPDYHPPLRTLSAGPNNLPFQVTPFIGREQQLHAVRDALLRPDTRLLTLTGPGGTGKTRLALQVAADLLDSFANGIFFVPLAPVRDPDLVPSAIAQALDLRETSGRPFLESLRDFLRAKQMLLILDNFEQVVEAAPVVAALLGAVAGLRVLVTSRSVLRLYGEREYSVPPLALPDRRTGPSAAHLGQFESVRLFLDRAQATRPELTLTSENAAEVAEICHRVDGLPLAIELAAARIRSLSPRAMLQRMERRLPLLTGGARDLPARQRTLRDTIAWSYDLLEPSEQMLFRRLAVLRGFTLEAAESVCQGEPPRSGATTVALPPLDVDVLDGLESLVEKSLLRQEEGADFQPWYVMLETVREFALERLGESGEDAATHRRHVLAALRLAEAAEPLLHGPDQAIWFARLEQEHDNLRMALDWSESHGYAEPALRLGVALWWFWSAHGHVSEGRARLVSLLERFPIKPKSARAKLRATVLYAAGVLASMQGDHRIARIWQEEGLALRREIDDPPGIFIALEGAGVASCLAGDYDAARSYLEEAGALARELEDWQAYASVLNNLGNLAYELGDLSGARDHYTESLRVLPQVPDVRTQIGANLSLAMLAQAEGSYDEAEAVVSEALSRYRRSGNRRMEAFGLATLGSIEQGRGNHSDARDRLAASAAIFGQLGDAAGIAQVLERFVELAAAQGRPDGAIVLAAAAARLRERIEAPLLQTGTARFVDAVTLARREVGEEAATEAWRRGEALDHEQAVAAALAMTEPAPLTEEAADAAVPARSDSVLTPREQEVAALIARGLTNRQIADTLVITEGTAANHVVHILSKLGYGSRTQVAVWAVEHDLAIDTS